ncbi:MAG: galactose-1-phosphate uridylyltransferase, partial [Thermoanaerobaculia bacterium]
PILFAPERRVRPNAFEQRDATPVAVCPFCPGNESETPPEIARIGTPQHWDVRVVPNRFPAVGTGGMRGVHEVVVDSPEHDATLGSLTATQRVRALRAYRERFAAHRRNRAIRHVVVFRNEGRRAGQSIVHPHAQVIGLGTIPDRIRGEAALLRSRARKGLPCLVCDELRSPDRLIAANDRFAAIAPDASRSAYQVRIVPRRHGADFGQIDDADLDALGALLGTLLRAIDRALGRPAHNLLIQSAPLRAAGADVFHWYVEIVPRLTVDGGFELATGIPINIVAPEDAAAELRGALEET